MVITLFRATMAAQYSRSPLASSTQTMTMAMHRAQPTRERPDMKEVYFPSLKKAMACTVGKTENEF